MAGMKGGRMRGGKLSKGAIKKGTMSRILKYVFKYYKFHICKGGRAISALLSFYINIPFTVFSSGKVIPVLSL